MIGKKFVILRGVLPENIHCKFFSDNTQKDPTIINDGRTAYEVMGYADTVAEAQTILYGRAIN